MPTRDDTATMIIRVALLAFAIGFLFGGLAVAVLFAAAETIDGTVCGALCSLH